MTDFAKGSDFYLNFGKYKGQSVYEINDVQARSYYKWAIDNVLLQHQTRDHLKVVSQDCLDKSEHVWVRSIDDCLIRHKCSRCELQGPVSIYKTCLKCKKFKNCVVYTGTSPVCWTCTNT